LLRLVRMKRTNLVLDEHLLDEAKRLSGERTYSATVQRALADFVRRAHAGRSLELAGSGLWEGDLAAMRGDSGASSPGPAGTSGPSSAARLAGRGEPAP
jgi:hypothetical protein